MKRASGNRFRSFSVVTLLCFLTACTKSVAVNPDAAITEPRLVHGLVAIHLLDTRTIVSDKVSVAEDRFVVASVRENGEMREVAPMTIPRAEVESIDLISKNYRPVWIVGGAALLVLMLFFAHGDAPGFGD